MKLADLVREDSIVPDFAAPDKWKAIDRLVDHLVAAGRVKAGQRKRVHDAVVGREKLSSTGMENGVALPHAQVDGIDEPVAAFAVAPKGVPFGCADGKDATLIALLVIPRRTIKPYVRTLAGIARLLNSSEMRNALLQSKTAKEVAETLAREEAKEFA